MPKLVFLGRTDDGHEWWRGKGNCECVSVTVEGFGLSDGEWKWTNCCLCGVFSKIEKVMEDEMPLNLTVNDGEEFTPFIKYNAKSGRFSRRVENEHGDQVDREVVNPRLAFDFAGIKTGWITFIEGSAPQKQWDPPGGTAEKPNWDRVKRGFEVMVYGSDKVPGGEVGMREFSSTANAVINQIKIMYGRYEDEIAANPGGVMVWKCTGVNELKTKHGPNYEPVFEFEKWIGRADVPGLGELQDAPPPEPVPNPAPEYSNDDIPF